MRFDSPLKGRNNLPKTASWGDVAINSNQPRFSLKTSPDEYRPPGSAQSCSHSVESHKVYIRLDCGNSISECQSSARMNLAQPRVTASTVRASLGRTSTSRTPRGAQVKQKNFSSVTRLVTARSFVRQPIHALAKSDRRTFAVQFTELIYPPGLR